MVQITEAEAEAVAGTRARPATAMANDCLNARP